MNPTSTEAEPVADVSGLPLSERQEALEAAIVDEFRRSLELEDAEEFPLDESFFELGCTSLKLLDVARRLESRLGLPVSTNHLFNNPTVDQLVEHLLAESAAGS